MLPLKQEFIHKLNLYGEEYTLKYQEATAEQSQWFYSNVNTYADFSGWLTEFINSLDSLTKKEKSKIMKWIYSKPEETIQTIYKNLINTRFRRYTSKYSEVKSRPKVKGGASIQGCSASTELELSKATMTPVYLLNKELTLYQRGWLEDGLICNNLNTYKEWQALNRSVRRKTKKQENPELYKKAKKKIDNLASRLKDLDSKKE